MGWGVSPEADEKTKLKAEMADFLKGLNSTGVVDYDTHSEIFDYSMKLLDKMHELGSNEKDENKELEKAEATGIQEVEFFEYDMTPTKDNEVIMNFKVNGEECEIKVPYKTLKGMTRLVELELLCIDCKREEKSPGLEVCGSCYHERIWG